MSTPPTAPRRVSKAAALRHRQALADAAVTAHQLTPQAAGIINQFNITRYGTTSQPVRPFLVEAIRLSNLTGAESINKHCRHLSALAVFADAQGLNLTVAAVLTTDTINHYVSVGMAGETADNRAERRRRLLWVARAANPGPSVPATLSPIGYEAVKAPYTPTERATIIRATRTQPTARKGEQLGAVVGLGFGAGADSVDLRELWVRDIVDHGPAGLSVHFHGPRPRVVPVRRFTEGLLRAALAGRAPDELVIGADINRRNTAARIIEKAALYKVPHIEPARMRTTWLADVMTDPIPLAVILHAAGLKSARTLTDVLTHIDPWVALKTKPAATTGDQLRGGTR